MKKYYQKNKEKLKKSTSVNTIKKSLANKNFSQEQIENISQYLYFSNLIQKYYAKDSLEYSRFSDLKVLIRGKQIKNRRTKKQIEDESKHVNTIIPDEEEVIKIKPESVLKEEPKKQEGKINEVIPVQEKKIETVLVNIDDKSKENKDNINQKS
jgi:hypothetical protein